MNNKGRDIFQVLGATAVALGLILTVVILKRMPPLSEPPLRADSALHLAKLSLDLDHEGELLKQETWPLGTSISTAKVEERFAILKSQMEAAGLSSKDASGVLRGVALAKEPTFKSYSSNSPRMWPVSARTGYIKGQRVEIIQLAYPIAPADIEEGSLSPEEQLEMEIAFRIYVVDSQAPYRTWLSPYQIEVIPHSRIPSYHLRTFTPQEASIYRRDYETPPERKQFEATQRYLEGQRQALMNMQRRYDHQKKYEQWLLRRKSNG